MSFLNQLKTQAEELQRAQQRQQHQTEHAVSDTEAACKRAWFYLEDLAKQLNVIEPPGPPLSLDGKTPWPAMRMRSFRLDARKKPLRGQEVYDYLALWWRLVPAQGPLQSGTLSVNFPPDLKRVEQRLAMGQVKHERQDVRHPEKNSLLAYRFIYETESRGSVTVTPDHDRGRIRIRVCNARGFEAIERDVAVQELGTGLLDELARLMMGQAHRFV